MSDLSTRLTVSNIFVRFIVSGPSTRLHLASSSLFAYPPSCNLSVCVVRLLVFIALSCLLVSSSLARLLAFIQPRLLDPSTRLRPVYPPRWSPYPPPPPLPLLAYLLLVSSAFRLAPGNPQPGVLRFSLHLPVTWPRHAKNYRTENELT